MKYNPDLQFQSIVLLVPHSCDLRIISRLPSKASNYLFPTFIASFLDRRITAFAVNLDTFDMQPSTHSIQTSVPVPTVRQAAGKNNIKPKQSHAKNAHAPHASAPSSSAINTAGQTALIATVAVPNKAHAVDVAENVQIESDQRSSSKQQKDFKTLFSEWDWN
jgi:hypothetical protein